MEVTIDRRGRVRARAALVLPVSAGTAWGQIRDVRRFIAIDPLHVRVTIDCSRCERGTMRGAELRIRHRLAGIGPERIGRILWWREGRGFAFSDLSARGRRVGFPHICGYELEPIDGDTCKLVVTARGRWTARVVPRPLARLWIGWVLRATEARIAAEFWRLRRWRDGQRA